MSSDRLFRMTCDQLDFEDERSDSEVESEKSADTDSEGDCFQSAMDKLTL